MRYYSIVLTRSDGTPFLFKSLSGLALTSLLPSGPQQPPTGQANRAALGIEFDIPVSPLHAPDANAWLRIWGLGLQDIGNAANLNGLNVAIYAGMSKGLPLANPQQAGLIMQGQVYQAFGNWIGTDQTIDMNFIAGGNVGSPDEPANFPFSWAAGTPLATAIAQTLSIAAPGQTQQIGISPRLVLNYDVTGWYQSARQFADFINEISSTIIGGTYNGVSIVTNGMTVRVFDGTQPVGSGAIRQIAFQDLIGQPTWFAGGLVSAKMVLRADINVGDTIQLPPALYTIGSADAAQYLSQSVSNRLTFSGKFLVNRVHHYGNSRQADSASWASVYELAANPASSAASIGAA